MISGMFEVAESEDGGHSSTAAFYHGIRPTVE
jgi:hypothetical protein